MISNRKIAANRRNAARSTGPRTAGGKVRSSRNALRHGLAAAMGHEPGRSTEVEQLACAIAGERLHPALLYYARAAAEAELDIVRVRAARASAIEPETEPGANAFEHAAVVIAKLDRYERRALSRRTRALRALASASMEVRKRSRNQVRS